MEDAYNERTTFKQSNDMKVQQGNRVTSEKGIKRAVVQSCLFEAKSYNQVLNNQWLASLNFLVLGNLHQMGYSAGGRALW